MAQCYSTFTEFPSPPVILGFMFGGNGLVSVGDGFHLTTQNAW